MTESSFQKVLAARPLPQLAAWLEAKGHPDRAEDYNEWAELAGWVEELQAQGGPHLSERDQHFVFLCQGMGVATVELCNAIAQRGGSVELLVQALPRVMGMMSMYCFASIADDKTPWRKVLTLFVEEFRHGARFAADELTEAANAA